MSAAGSHDDEAFEHLLASLPASACDEIRRRVQVGERLPQTADELLALIGRWTTGAGTAEEHGGQPRSAPDWVKHVKRQQRNVALYHAAVEAFDEANNGRKRLFKRYANRFRPDVRHLGEGYEPHVDDVAGQLIYSLPVDSGFVSWSFSFRIGRRDLDVLLADPYRRAVLEVVAHTTLQRSMIRGNTPVKEIDFAGLVSSVLHSAPEELRRFVVAIDREHNMSTDHYARQAMARRFLD